jgi:hypothetical protein
MTICQVTRHRYHAGSARETETLQRNSQKAADAATPERFQLTNDQRPITPDLAAKVTRKKKAKASKIAGIVKYWTLDD